MPSRQSQLDLKHATAGQDGDQGGGRGRGRGRGKGRGRGRGAGKGGNDDPKPKSRSKRKDEDKHEEEDTKNTKKRTKKADPKHTDPNQEWYQHWVNEWGEDWEGQGWNQADKRWDEYAWWDGNKSIDELKRETTPPVDAPVDTPPEASNSKAPAASSSKTSPAAKSKGERKEKVKKVEKAFRRPAAAKAPQKTDKVVAQADKEKKTEKKKGPTGEAEVPEEIIRVPVGQKKQVKAMVEFWKRIQSIAPNKDEDTKFALQMILQTPTNCTLNVYWSRGSVGVKCCTLKKDFAYFTCPKAENRTWQMRMAISCKAAEIMVP